MTHPFLQWLPPETNPWQIPILNVAPFTLTMISTSADPTCAENALSYTDDDGSRFARTQPRFPREQCTDLTYRITGQPASGPLFVPTIMEQKWAIFLLGDELVFVRSWLAEVRVRATVNFTDDRMQVISLNGAFFDADEDPAWTLRCFDFLVRSHLTGTDDPAPLPPHVGDDWDECAQWAFAAFGIMVAVVAREPLPADLPAEPIAFGRPQNGSPGA